MSSRRKRNLGKRQAAGKRHVSPRQIDIRKNPNANARFMLEQAAGGQSIILTNDDGTFPGPRPPDPEVRARVQTEAAKLQEEKRQRRLKHWTGAKA